MTMKINDNQQPAVLRTAPDWHFAEIKSFADIPRHWARQSPEKTGLCDNIAARSYAQIDSHSNQLANQLIAQQMRQGTNIGYFGKNTMAFFEIWFGVLKARCSMAPFNWRCAVAELVDIIADSQTPLIFVDREFEETMQQVQSQSDHTFDIIIFDPSETEFSNLSGWCGSASTDDPNLPWHGSDTVLQSYTSGTTGLPKGVMSSEDAFQNSFLIGALEPEMAWQRDDISLMSMPCFHLGGSWVSLEALYHGATIAIIPNFEPQLFLDMLRRERPTRASLVPAAIQILLDRDDVTKSDFESMHTILYFGSPIAHGLLQRAMATLDCKLMQIYGTTETWSSIMLRPSDHDDPDAPCLKSCGQPLALVQIEIRDADDNALPTEEVGEIAIRSPVVMTGYWNRPEATREVYRDGWYYTGDLGYKDADDYIYIVDRAKDMIISGGENIYSVEVEQALLKLDGVAMCAAIGLPDEKWGERVTAAIVAAPDSQLDEAQVIAHCRELIAGYKAPKQVIFLDQLPQTPTGKVQKAALRKQLTSQ